MILIRYTFISPYWPITENTHFLVYYNYFFVTREAWYPPPPIYKCHKTCSGNWIFHRQKAEGGGGKWFYHIYCLSCVSFFILSGLDFFWCLFVYSDRRLSHCSASFWCLFVYSVSGCGRKWSRVCIIHMYRRFLLIFSM